MHYVSQKCRTINPVCVFVLFLLNRTPVREAYGSAGDHSVKALSNVSSYTLAESLPHGHWSSWKRHWDRQGQVDAGYIKVFRRGVSLKFL